MDIVLPLMGEGVNEATVVKWLKALGEVVQKDEPLFEVSTDKVDTEIPSPANGVVAELIAKEGEVVAVNQVIARLNTDDSASQNKLKTSAQAEPAYVQSEDAPAQAQMVSQTPSLDGRTPGAPDSGASLTNRRASPLVKKLAREHNIDLAQVTGSGVHGRITKFDVQHFLDRGLATSPVIGSQSTTAPRSPSTGLVTQVRDGQEFLEGVAIRREKMSKMRKLIADHMVRSMATSPHASIVFEVDIHRLEALRNRIKEPFKGKHGFAPTYTAFFVEATKVALLKHPILNVSVDGDDILYKQDINIGVAAAVGNGLMVPVIKRCQERNFLGIATGLDEIVRRARSAKLQAEDVVGGSFTITNHGGWGSLSAQPIINQPQVAILGIGAIVKRPVVVGDMIAIRPLVHLTLTFDHRVVDGEGAAAFMNTMIEALNSLDERLEW